MRDAARPKFAFGVGLLLLSTTLSAQQGPAAREQTTPLDEYQIRVFGVEDGLPHRWVSRIEQTPDGFLYVPTGQGLMRFDGLRFQPVPLPGFRSSFLRTTMVDATGRLWFQSNRGEIGFVFEGQAHLVDIPPGLDVPNFSATDDGSAWLTGGGLMRFPPHGDPQVTVRPPEPANPEPPWVLGLLTLPSGEDVAFTDKGLAHLVDGSGSGTPQLELTEPLVEAGSFAAAAVDDEALWIGLDTAVLVVRDGRLRSFPSTAAQPALQPDAFHWRSGETALIRLPLARHLRIPAIPLPRGGSADHVRLMLRARDGTLWMVVTDRLDDRTQDYLVRVRAGRYVLVPLRSSVSFEEVTSLMEDQEGSIWVTTDQGPIQLVQRRVLALTTRQGLAEGFTTAVLQDFDGALWVGTWGGGLHRFMDGRLTLHLDMADGLPSDRVRSLYQTPDSTLWIGTEVGLATFVDGTLRSAVTTPPERTALGGSPAEVRAFAQAPDGTLWMADRHHVRVRMAGEWEEYKPGFWRGSDLWILHVARDGGVWAGGERGLFRIDGNQVRAFGEEDGLRSPFVVSAWEEPDGDLWFGTYQQGLHRWRGGRFTAITRENGLHSNGVWCMMADGAGGVWMSSDQGIFRVEQDRLDAVADALEDGRTVEPLTPVVFQEPEGVPSRESNRASPGCWALSDGRLAFNSQDGVTLVDPLKALEPVSPPRTVVQAVEADGAPLEDAGAERTHVPAGTRHLSFDYAAVSYVAPSQTRFRYRLDGFDEDWIDAGPERKTTYTGLPPGRYTFRAQAAVGQSAWGARDAASYAFVLDPLPWQRRSVQLLAILLGAAALVFAYRIRIRRLLEMERLRLRIAADLHDDIGSSVSSIALLSEILEDNPKLDEAERAQLTRIHGAARESMEGLRDIIWLVDPLHGNLRELLRKMRVAARDLLGGVDYAITLPQDVDEAPLSMLFARNTLLFYKEALNNVARHAHARHVDICVSTQGRNLTVEIHDDGRGFRPEAHSQGHGLVNMRRRADELGGTLAIRSDTEGTRLRFEVPMA